MEITKEQIKRLSKAVTEIEKDVLIDDDVIGGYLPEPYKTSIVEIYNVINECEGSMHPSTESKLNMPVINNSLQNKLYGALIMTVISALMWLIYILANCC